MDNSPDIVDLVLYFLAGLSIFTWTILMVKSYVFWRLQGANTFFMSSITGMTRLTKSLEMQFNTKGSLSSLSSKVINDIQAWRKDASLDVNAYHDLLQQSLRQERHHQQVRLESGLAALASIGSVSPFVGLFGTVWGIMHALKGISASGSAGLDVVAGAIGEALIATAMGIATAIPAVLAYNYFLRQSRLAAADMDHFSERLQILAKHSDYKVE